MIQMNYYVKYFDKLINVFFKKWIKDKGNRGLTDNVAAYYED